MYEVTLWPVLAAGFAAVFIGFIWYNPKVFGSAWMRMTGISAQMAESGRKKMPFMAFFGFLAAVVMAYVMAHFGIVWGVFDWIGAVELAFWIWLGFVVPPMLGVVLWEGKSFKLYLLNAAYWLVAMIAMALILTF